MRVENAEKDFTDKLVVFTENLLTRRARKIEKKKRKQKARGPVMEWVDAFLWAVMVVLLLNQYLLQAYQIPSGSMRNTLIGGVNRETGRRDTSDRIFVNKFIFGFELLPGCCKTPGFREPERSEVIIFENPEYEKRSIAYEIVQRVLYMATLSMLDLNRIGHADAHQFLIKRQVAQDGDRVNFIQGELYIQPRGSSEMINEEDFKKESGLTYGNHLLLDNAYYKNLDAKIKASITDSAGLPVDKKTAEEASAEWISGLKTIPYDRYEEERISSDILRKLYPYHKTYVNINAAKTNGIYVPKGWVLPLGDNRNDSLDGRYFGPVRKKDLLGKALFIYWPLNRFGVIK